MPEKVRNITRQVYTNDNTESLKKKLNDHSKATVCIQVILDVVYSLTRLIHGFILVSCSRRTFHLSYF